MRYSIALVTLFLSLSLNLIFISCAAKTPVTTWIIGVNGLTHKTVRVDEAKSFMEAQGYRCYEEQDDLIIRDRMALCCSRAGM
jgi:hypothetical protein